MLPLRVAQGPSQSWDLEELWGGQLEDMPLGDYATLGLVLTSVHRKIQSLHLGSSITGGQVVVRGKPGIQAVSVSGSMGCGHFSWGGQLSCICLDIVQPSLD